MKEPFIEKRFSASSESLIGKITPILDAYGSQGYDLSLRQLFYQLVAKNLVQNTFRNYKKVGKLVSDARLAGLIDWEMIKDRGRILVQHRSWDGVPDILQSAAQAFRVSRWNSQPCYVEVMVEKQALEGVLIPVCDRLHVPFTSNKGYSSSSAMYEAGQRLSRCAKQGKELHVLYLGDHDPSGIDMTRDVGVRLEKFAGGPRVAVRRLALNMDQIEALNLPQNFAKDTDSRASAYVKLYGGASWELDAIEPTQLARMVENAIANLIEPEAWNLSIELEKAGRHELIRIAESYA